MNTWLFQMVSSEGYQPLLYCTVPCMLFAWLEYLKISSVLGFQNFGLDQPTPGQKKKLNSSFGYFPSKKLSYFLKYLHFFWGGG